MAIERVVLGRVLQMLAPNVLPGASPEDVERELASVEWWGTPRWCDEFFEANSETLQGSWATEEFRRFVLRTSLRTCTPTCAGRCRPSRYRPCWSRRRTTTPSPPHARSGRRCPVPRPSPFQCSIDGSRNNITVQADVGRHNMSRVDTNSPNLTCDPLWAGGSTYTLFERSLRRAGLQRVRETPRQGYPCLRKCGPARRATVRPTQAG